MSDALAAEQKIEIATAQKDPYCQLFDGLMTPNDATLATRGGAKGLRIYDEIERDCHAFSVLQKRKLALIARNVIVDAASESLRDRKARDGVEAMLKSINFDQVCLDLLDATLKGFSVAEIIWGIANSSIAPAKIKPKDQRRFKFDTDENLRLITRGNLAKGDALPERKFIVHRYGAKDGNPYGLGLGTRLFWPVFFKRQGIQFWLTFADKFGSPTAVGKYPSSASAKDKDVLLEAIGALANDAGVTIPENMAIEFLEAARSGSINTYESLCRYMDEEISKAVLGETLSTNMSSSGGSYGASKTHNEVRLELTQADADLLSDTLNATLVKWFCEYNFPGANPPKVWRDFEEPEDLNKRAETDKKVCEMGFEPSLDYIRATYGDGWEKKQAAQPVAQPPATDEPAFSENNFPAAQQAIAQGADALANNYDQLIAPRLESLIAVLEETQDLTLFRQELSELLTDNAMSATQDALVKARLNAWLLGRSE